MSFQSENHPARTAPKAPIFAAIDTTDLTRARFLADSVRPYFAGIKLGLEFFLSHGHTGYRDIAQAGTPVFLDLKLHDIPNTVAGALRAVAPLAPAYLTLHASGGREMMQRAADTLKTQTPTSKCLAVTLLTSLDQTNLTDMNINIAPLDQVRRLVELARTSGMDGIVCSPAEVAVIRSDQGPDFDLIVPGIRPQGAEKGDQKRVMSPGEALRAGATALVIGRPVSAAPDPAEAAQKIADEIRYSLAQVSSK